MMRPSNDLPVVYLCRDAVLTLQEQLNLALA
jgi:hypothetical protein